MKHALDLRSGNVGDRITNSVAAARARNIEVKTVILDPEDQERLYRELQATVKFVGDDPGPRGKITYYGVEIVVA